VLHVLAVVSFPSGRGRRAPSDPSPRDLGARSRAPWPRRRSWCWASSTVSTTQQGEGEARSRREGYWSSSIGAGAGRGGSSKERCPRRRQRVPRHLLPLRRRRRAHHHLPSEARIRRRDVDPGPAASLPICTWPRGALEERGGAHGRWLGEATTSFTPVGRLLPHAAALPPPPPRRLSSSSPSARGSQRPGSMQHLLRDACWRRPSSHAPASSLSFSSSGDVDEETPGGKLRLVAPRTCEGDGTANIPLEALQRGPKKATPCSRWLQ
jgi:hypothetical protein